MKHIILAALVATMFAGCFGVADSEAAFGDEVTVTWTAYDLYSDQVISQGTDLSFILGSGASGLGRDFERNLIGAGEGETVTFDSESDPTRPYGQIVSTPRDQLDPYEQVQDVDATIFVNALGMEPVAGLQFNLTFFPAQVLSVNGETVTYQVMPAPGQRDSIDFVGVFLVTDVRDGMVYQSFEANPGATFTVQPPSAYNPEPPLEGLGPGNYRTRGMNETHILYDFTTSTDIEGLSLPLRFEVTITTIVRAPAVEFDEDAFTTRTSPQLLADPAAVQLVSDSMHGSHSSHAAHDEEHSSSDDHTH